VQNRQTLRLSQS